VPPSDSPVPPADGVVTSERLAALLALATEYDDLDYKRMLDLSTTREEVELAKDVGAMNVKGGYIVIGADGHGNPTGDMDGVDTAVFDAANLVPKMERYMEGPLGITTSVLTWEQHTVVLVCVRPNPRGCTFFRRDGQYTPTGGDRPVAVFRAGEVFWRQGTRSVRITGEGLEEIVERRFSARRDELLREWAAAHRAVNEATGEGGADRGREGGGAPSGGEGGRTGRGLVAEPTFSLSSDEVTASALALLRAGDEIGLRQLLEDGRRRGRSYIDGELDEEQLSLLLDSAICLAATFLTYEAEEWFDRAIALLVDLYAAAATAERVLQLGLGTQIAATEKGPRVWLAIIRRVYALGGLAVRREAWRAVRTLAVQLPGPVAQNGYDTNWLRHALTMASRARHFGGEVRGQPQIGLIDLAREDSTRLDCLRSDGVRPEDEELLTSLAQFDVLSNLAAIDDADEVDGRVFYTNFARFRQTRIQPVVERLLTDQDARLKIFRSSNADLAVALAAIGELAGREGIWFDGFRSWDHTAVGQFIAENLPPEQAGG
jgi:hypothetical protein